MGKSYSVTTLAPTGAGKTVYMLALTHRLLREARLAEGVVCSLEPPSEEDKFEEQYELLADSTAEWPRATLTAGSKYLTIMVDVHARRGVFRVLEFSYSDLPGSVGTQPSVRIGSEEATKDYNERIRGADALFVFIDGAQLLRRLADQITAQQFAEECLRPLIVTMEKVRVPIHLAVTKWDLLDKQGVQLRHVRNLLLTLDDEEWQRLLDAKRGLGTRGLLPPGMIRLIPVSSVGAEFATAKNNNVAGVRPRPLNVHIPFVSVIPDLSYAQLQLALQNGARDGETPGQPPATNLSMEATGTFSNGSPFKLTEVLRTALAIGGPAARAGHRMARRRRQNAKIWLAGRRTPSLRRVHDTRTALEYTTAALHHQAKQFDRGNRDSRLT